MNRVVLAVIALFPFVPAALVAQAQQPTASLQYFDDASQISIADPNGAPITSVSYGMDLEVGDTITTKNSTAEIQLEPNGSILKLAADTVFEIQGLQGDATGDQANAFKLAAGKLRTIAAHSDQGGNNYSIATPTSVCGVRGTDFSLDVVPGAVGAVGVLTGQVDYVDTKTSQTIVVAAGMYADTLAPTFQAIKLSPDQTNSLFTTMNFTKLDPTKVPGHAQEVAAVQSAQPQQPAPAVQPPAPQPAPAAKQAPGPFDAAFAFLRDHLGMDVGTLSIDGATYESAVLEPEFAVGSLQVGLYLPIIYQDDLFNPSDWYQPNGMSEWSFGVPAFESGDIRDGASQFVSDLLLKIDYLEWGKQRDPFYLKIGNLNDLSIGHGFLMDSYANDEDFPATRRTGFNIGADFGQFGFEAAASDLGDVGYLVSGAQTNDPELLGGRVYVRPINGFRLALGLSSVIDFNPAADLISTGTSSDGNPILISGGVDLDLPIIETDPFSVVAFADAGGLVPYFQSPLNGSIPSGLYYQAFYDPSNSAAGAHNYGFAGGLLGNVSDFTWRLEFRGYNGIFQPGLFNATYDRTRSLLVQNLANYLADPSSQQYQSPTLGIYGQGGYNFGNLASFEVGYLYPWQPDGAPSNNDYFHLRFALNKGVIPGFGLHGSISYDRTEFIPTLLNSSGESLSLFDANTTLTAELVYPVAPSLDLALLVVTAVETDSNGQPILDPSTGLPKVYPTITVETRVHP